MRIISDWSITLRTARSFKTKLQELGYPDLSIRFVTAAAPDGWVRPGCARFCSENRRAPRRDSDGGGEHSAARARAAAEARPVKPVAASKEDFKNDPLIKQALEIFKGQIVEIRA